MANDRDWQEDISQSLLLEGWKVWRDTGNEGLARHRMSSRANNEKEKLFNTLAKQPRPATSLGLGEAADEYADGADSSAAYHADGCELPYCRTSPMARASPAEDMVVQEYLDGLPDRKRQIVQCLMAMMKVPEIARRLGVSTRTVERELAEIRKDYRDEHAE